MCLYYLGYLRPFYGNFSESVVDYHEHLKVDYIMVIRPRLCKTGSRSIFPQSPKGGEGVWYHRLVVVPLTHVSVFFWPSRQSVEETVLKFFIFSLLSYH